MIHNTYPILITVDGAGYDNYNGHNVKIGGVQAYHRPYDGSDDDDVMTEACRALGELLRDKLGLKEEATEEDSW
jgi:hypothetical protein